MMNTTEEKDKPDTIAEAIGDDLDDLATATTHQIMKRLMPVLARAARPDGYVSATLSIFGFHNAHVSHRWVVDSGDSNIPNSDGYTLAEAVWRHAEKLADTKTALLVKAERLEQEARNIREVLAQAEGGAK